MPTPTEPWRATTAVTAALSALCRPGSQHAASSAIDHALGLEPEEGLAVFSGRLALTVLDADAHDTGTRQTLVEHMSNLARSSNDGYALRDLLGHPVVREHLTPDAADEFKRVLASCALGSTVLPKRVLGWLEGALANAKAVLQEGSLDSQTVRGIRSSIASKLEPVAC